MKKCIVNFEDREIVEKLTELGFNCIPVITSEKVSKPISAHSDVLYNKIDNDTIMASSCQKANFSHLDGYNVIEIMNFSPGYTTECLLNFIVNDRYVIRNKNTAIKYDFDRTEINVNQGYTKCSCLCINDNSYITGDVGIYERLKSKKMNCLLVDDKDILLNGYDHGFIGGASVKLNESEVLFFGDINNKIDKQNIISFAEKQGIICHFIKNKRLTDIGSALILGD